MYSALDYDSIGLLGASPSGRAAETRGSETKEILK